jgi:hypothetical protein
VQNVENKLHKLVSALCATEQEDMIGAAEELLSVLLRGAVMLRQARKLPSFAAAAVTDLLLSVDSSKPKPRRKQ